MDAVTQQHARAGLPVRRVLIGHSLGAVSAALAAISHPQVLASLPAAGAHDSMTQHLGASGQPAMALASAAWHACKLALRARLRLLGLRCWSCVQDYEALVLVAPALMAGFFSKANEGLGASGQAGMSGQALNAAFGSNQLPERAAPPRRSSPCCCARDPHAAAAPAAAQQEGRLLNGHACRCTWSEHPASSRCALCRTARRSPAMAACLGRLLSMV